MGRALVAPVQRRRRSGELKSPGSRDLTPTVASRGSWSHAKQAAENSPGGEFIL